MKKLFFGRREMKRKIVLGLLFLLLTVNVFADPIANTSPVAAGVYVDRFTDTAFVFTVNSVSYVNWPSGTVIWTITQSEYTYNVANLTRSWSGVTGAGNQISMNITENYFAILIPGQERKLFSVIADTIEVRFEPVTRNGRMWIDVWWGPIFDPFGTYGLVARDNIHNAHISDLHFHKSYVRQ